MVNVELPLQRYDIDTSNRIRAVASVNMFVTGLALEKQAQSVDDLLADVFGMRLGITDPVLARLTIQYVVDTISQNHYEFGNAPKLLEEAKAKAEAFYRNPLNAWMFATSESQSSFRTDSDAPKAPKKNKGTEATELYNIHVRDAETPLTNIQFVELLVKEMGMTKSGARTYAYNCFKAGKEAK